LAPDLSSGDLLRKNQTEAPRKNRGWALTADDQRNEPLLFWSNWRKAPILAALKLFGVGSIFSSPPVVGGAVYVGSADGTM
jgi:hypothetical protein